MERGAGAGAGAGAGWGRWPGWELLTACLVIGAVGLLLRLLERRPGGRGASGPGPRPRPGGALPSPPPGPSRRCSGSRPGETRPCPAGGIPHPPRACAGPRGSGSASRGPVRGCPCRVPRSPAWALLWGRQGCVSGLPPPLLHWGAQRNLPSSVFSAPGGGGRCCEAVLRLRNEMGRAINRGRDAQELRAGLGCCYLPVIDLCSRGLFAPAGFGLMQPGETCLLCLLLVFGREQLHKI